VVVHALYEDQAGTFDWYRPFFGRITSAAFLPGKPRLLVAAPGNGLVGAIDTATPPPSSSSAAAALLAATAADGPIAWRRPHPRDDPFAGAFVLAARPPVAVVASAGGRVLRAWDAADGPFRWEAALPRTAFEAGAALTEGGGAAAAPDDASLAASAALSHAVATADASPGAADGPSVIVVARAAPLGDAAGGRAELQVQARDAARGGLLWRAALAVAVSPSPAFPLPRVLVSADAVAGTATVAWWSDGASELHAATFVLGGRDAPPPGGAAGALAAGSLTTQQQPPPPPPPPREPMGPVRTWLLPAPLRASAPAALLGNALAVAAEGGLVCATAEAAATRAPGTNERPGPLGCAAPPGAGDGGDDGGDAPGVEVSALVPGSPDAPTFMAAYAGSGLGSGGGGGGGGVAIFAASVGRDAEPVLVKAFADATAVSAAVVPAAGKAAAERKPSRWVSAVVAAPAAALPSSSAAAAAAVAAASARRATLVRIVDAATGQVLSAEKSALPPSVAGAHARRHSPRAAPAVPRLAVLNGGGGAAAAAAKPSSSSSAPAPSLQVATVWSDHALTLSSGRLVAWVRDEALGTLDDSAFVDLPTAGQQQQQQQQQEEGAPPSSGPASSSAAHPDAALHALGHTHRLRAWLRLQYVSALVQLHVATPAERFEQRSLRGALSDRALPHRDANGLRKLVLGVSGGARKAVAIHNGDGHVVWEHDLPAVGGSAAAAGGGRAAAAAAAVAQAAAAAAGAEKTRLATWRTFHDTQHAPQVAVVRLVDGARTADGRARARGDVLDAHTGAAVPIGGGGGVDGGGGEGGSAADDSGQEFVLPAGTEPRLVTLPFTVKDDGGGGAAAADQRVFLLLAVPTTTDGGSGDGGGDGGSSSSSSPLPPPPAVVALLPRGSAAALAALRARRPAPRFWLLRGGASPSPALEGYEVAAAAGPFSPSPEEEDAGEDAGAAAAAAAPRLSLSRVWRLELPGRVLAAAARPSGQPLHSAVKVLGDRTLRVKHTEPNTLVAVCDASPSSSLLASAQASAGGGAGGAGVAASLAVEALVVDGATGRVLHRALHPGGRGPASALASEHWAAYAFEDAGRMRHQLSVAELYSSAPLPLSLAAAVSGAAARAVADSGGGGGGGFSATGGEPGAPAPSSSSSSSARATLPPRPAVAAQSFYFQRPVTGLAVTATAAGITPQQLLVSTADGRVAALDRRFVDARRPLLLAGRKATASEIEEGLIPYQDTLPVWGSMHATYHRQVSALRGVTVAPAGLESVCLLFARGSDLFATRLAPAKHFDALEPDFNYVLLVAALAALAAGAAFARFSSRRAVVRAKWQ